LRKSGGVLLLFEEFLSLKMFFLLVKHPLVTKSIIYNQLAGASKLRIKNIYILFALFKIFYIFIFIRH